MSKESDGSTARTDEVGDGIPPNAHQIKPRAQPREDAVASKPKRRKRDAGEPKKVDLALLMLDPVPVNQHGRAQKMDPFEAMLRKQVERAVKHRSPSAIKAILDIATEYDLIERPAKARSGGVLVVPFNTDEEVAIWRSFANTPRSRPGSSSGGRDE